MEIPHWAKWHGEHKEGFTLFLSDTRSLILKDDVVVDEDENISPLKLWEECGWELVEIDIDLENK
jgi:hypothetical protein